MVWKHSISFIGLHKGNLRRLAREGSANVSLHWNLYLIYFSVMYNLEVCGLTFDHNTLKDIANPEVIRRTYPTPIQDFIKAVERKV